MVPLFLLPYDNHKLSSCQHNFIEKALILAQIQGVLTNGTAIAVKQLSAKSKQGSREFVNEVGVISALQHPNLVKLLGCCIDENQLLLVYEYMENNSLAHALFGKPAPIPNNNLNKLIQFYMKFSTY